MQTQESQFDITTYQALALRTEKLLPTKRDRLIHAGLGLITEPGEGTSAIKRIAIYGKSLDDIGNKAKGTTLRQDLYEEVPDAFWYVAIAADVLGIDFFRATLPKLKPLRREGLRTEQRLVIAALSLSTAVGRFNEQVLVMDRVPESPGVLAQQLTYIGQELVNICDAADIDLRGALKDNIAKLRERFPDAYSDAAAEARADKGGLDARNS